MEIKINYEYKQVFLPTKRHKKSFDRSIQSSITVEVEEMQSDSFPIAFVVNDMESICVGAKTYWDFDNMDSKYTTNKKEIRTYGGKLYVPVHVTHGAAISTEYMTSEQIAEYIQCEIRSAFGFYSYESSFSQKSIIVSDNNDEVQDFIRNIIKKYVFFAGAFWMICAEPRYVINTFGLGHNHGGTGFFIEYHYNGNIPAKNYFNALQREEAIRYGQNVARNRGDTDSIDGIGKYDMIEVLMPEMVHCNPQMDHDNGDPFLNELEKIISSCNDTFTAGMFCIAHTIGQGANGEK